MQKPRIGRYIWNYVSPLLVREVAVYLIQMAVLLCSLLCPSESQSFVQNEWNTVVGQYATEWTTLASLLCIPILWHMIKKDRKGQQNSTKLLVSDCGKLCGFSCLLAIGCNNILMFSGIMQKSVSYQQTAEALYRPGFMVQIFCVGVCLPIVEEMMFRGLIYQRMRSDFGVWKAICLSAAVFGIYHGNIVQMLYAFISGIVLAYAMEFYGTLWASITIHIGMNLTSCILTEIKGFAWMYAKGIRMVGMTVICMLGVGWFLWNRKPGDKVLRKY